MVCALSGAIILISLLAPSFARAAYKMMFNGTNGTGTDDIDGATLDGAMTGLGPNQSVARRFVQLFLGLECWESMSLQAAKTPVRR
jgi:hypothetical protein